MINGIEMNGLMDLMYQQGSEAGDVASLERQAKATRTAAKTGSHGDVRKVAEQFESLLLGELYKVMRRTIPESSTGGGQLGRDVFTSMLDQEFASVTANRSPLGLASMVASQLGDKTSMPAGLKRLLVDPKIGWVQPVVDMPAHLSKGQQFGAQRTGDRNMACGDGHCGIDLGNPKGSKVVAVRDGMVSRIDRDENSAGGLAVSVRHPGGMVTRYLHLAGISPSITQGSRIAAGEAIGTVGDTGHLAKGVHLHFELLVPRGRSGKLTPVDSEPLIKQWRPIFSTVKAQSVDGGSKEDSQE